MSILGDIFGGARANKQNKYLGTALNTLKGQEQARFDPFAQQGVQAGGLIGQLLGLQGGSAGAEGLAQFRDSTGYRDTLNAATNGVATNAAARGLLGSSGTGKAFQNNAAQLAQGSFGDFLSRLMGQQQMGFNAAGAQADLGAQLGTASAQSTAQSKGSGLGFLSSLFG